MPPQRERITRTILDRSTAIAVLADIGLGPEKLVHEIAMSGMDLDPVGTDRHRVLRGTDIGLGEIVHLVRRHGSATLPLGREQP